jgi:ArsR family transcriptional regulator
MFRLLGDEDRLRLLALCAEEELTVGELAQLLGESQPQVSKKSQPLRDAGLLAARKEGTRTLLRAPADRDAVVSAALEEGRQLCARNGSLARIARVVAQRDELSRRYFEQPADSLPATGEAHGELLAWLPLLAPLLPGHALAVDVGTGEGSLLPLLSAIYTRVIAVDRSPARLARSGARIVGWGLPNVRLREGAVEDPGLSEDILARGGADLTLMARMLHHTARPQDAVVAAARLLRPGGHLIVADLLPHGDESLREQGHVWLGFEPQKLASFITSAGLELVASGLLPPASDHLPMHFAVGRRSPRTAA